MARQRYCKYLNCYENRDSYSIHNMCSVHEQITDAQIAQDFSNSPQGIALNALEEVATLGDMKEFLRQYFVETLP